MMKKGKILFMEVKAPGKTPTPLQFHEMEKIQKSGINAVWVDDFSNAVFYLENFYR
jgi:hypothetical protein